VNCAAELIRAAEAAGVHLRLTPEGSCKIAGDPAAVARWAPRLRPHKLEILATLQAGESEARHRRWRLTYQDGEVDELDCVPEATRSEVEGRYPGAEVEAVPTVRH